MVALRQTERNEGLIRHIHPIVVCEADLSDEGRADFGLGYPVHEDEPLESSGSTRPAPVLKEVTDRS